MNTFLNLEPVRCSMSSSNCCFLTCIQISQKAGKVVWYSQTLKRIFQSLLWSTQSKALALLMKLKKILFMEFLFYIFQWMLAIWSLVPVPFLNPACTSGSSQFRCCWSPAWRILSITLLTCEVSAIGSILSILWHCLSLGLEWKLTFSSPVATAVFSKFVGILSAVLSQYHLLRFEIVQLEFHHLH